MPKINSKLKTLDDLFAMEKAGLPVPEQPKAETEGFAEISRLSPDAIRPFCRHPFRLYEGERLDDLAESVKANGILTPVIVRKTEADENGREYEMLAGHNRMNAAKIAGLEAIPCIVKENLTDEEALIYVIETNLLQRSFSDMLPSEKAAALALRYSKMFSQGKRNDIIEELKKLENPQYIKENTACGNDFHKKKSRDILGESYSLTGRSVANYVRVDSVISPLKERLDNGELTLSVSVDLSYLSEAEQNMVEALLSENEYKVDMKKAELLRSRVGKLTAELAEEILSGEKIKKPKSDKPQPFKLKPGIYTKYFAPDTKNSEIERTIDEALRLYFKNAEDNG